jgi:hypothetical protein
MSRAACARPARVDRRARHRRAGRVGWLRPLRRRLHPHRRVSLVARAGETVHAALQLRALSALRLCAPTPLPVVSLHPPYLVL